MAFPVDKLTDKSNIKQVRDAIQKSTEMMMDEYAMDGKITTELDANVFQLWGQAWTFARKTSYELAREATGRKLPED